MHFYEIPDVVETVKNATFHIKVLVNESIFKRKLNELCFFLRIKYQLP